MRSLQPLLDIRAVRPNLFTYSLGASGAGGRECPNFFDSAECCLVDAGLGLAQYFDTVQLRFAGSPLGACPVSRLVDDAPNLLAERMAPVLSGATAAW